MFTLDKEGNLVIDKPEVREVPELKVILTRDKNRNKFTAFAELMYIYCVHHPESMYSELPLKLRRDKAKKHAKLDDDWKPDADIELAETAFIEGLKLSGVYSAYVNANRAVYSIGHDIDIFNEQKDKLRNKLIEVQNEILEEEDSGVVEELMMQEDALSRRLMTVTQNIQKLVEGLSQNMDTLKDLKKRLAEEKQKKAQIRGGGTVGNREG